MPVAEPVENVKICELYGAGFWYIPGTETCMQMGGYARLQVHLNSSNFGYDPWEGDPFQIRDESLDLRNDTFSMVARGLVNFDVRTETPYGALRSFIQIRGTAYDEDNASVELDLAFLQFAGFTAGLAPSFFNIEVPTEYLGHHIGDFSEDQIVFAYSAELGHGVQATLAVESGERANQDGFVFIDPDLLVVAPDADWAEAAEARNDLPALVAKLRVEQAWGTAGLAGAIGENRTRRLDIDFETGDPVAEHEESDLGWAIAGGLTIKVPVFGESDSVSVKASYSEGLSFYTLGSIPSLTWVGDDEISSAKVFSVFGGLTHYWTPTIRSNLAASLFDADFDFGDDSRVSGITTSANVIWSPVPNLDIGVELIYSNIDADTAAARVLGVTLDDDRADSINDDGFGAIFRIQRNFGS